MEKEQSSGMSYRIYSFMLEELRLSGSELLIFAIIYSFTDGGQGLYYGTQDFLASASGTSVSTVKRVISRLLEKKYIEKCQCGERCGYKALRNVKPKAQEASETSLRADSDRTSIKPHRHRIDMTDSGFYAFEPPKYVYCGIGREGIVSMTPEQHKSLLRLVEPEILQSYTRKLELLIANKGYRTFSPYKTIKKWILEDSSV